MSAVRPDPTILLLGAVLPIVGTAFIILLLKVKGFLFFDLGREDRKRPRLLAAPILVILTLAMSANTFFQKEPIAGGAWLVLCVAVIALSLTKSSREAKAELLKRMQAELAKQEAPR